MSQQDDQVDRLTSRDAKGETLLTALDNGNRRASQERPLRERLRPLQARIAAAGQTGLEADKAFYDELSGQ